MDYGADLAPPLLLVGTALDMFPCVCVCDKESVSSDVYSGRPTGLSEHTAKASVSMRLSLPPRS